MHHTNSLRKAEITMANIYKGTLGLIGNTPLVEVTNVEKELGLVLYNYTIVIIFLLVF